MNGTLERWWESLGIAAVIGLVGIASLGLRFEDWHSGPRATSPDTARCVALQADADATAPRCATIATADAPRA
ncbi:MAG: hypothetical protein JSR18_15980 [Proteobacteria bacterium]|nr:hypothetical protein [Pseudomonadota bacterium]